MKNKEESYHAFEILYWCGIHIGEPLALTAEDFDFEKKTLRSTNPISILKAKTLSQHLKPEKVIVY